MTEFSEQQQAALATLTTVYPAGIALTEDRVDDIAVCDSLVAAGHAVAVESADFEGKGYQLSAEMAAAHAKITDRADRAGQN
jgi:hypothetical protein